MTDTPLPLIQCVDAALQAALPVESDAGVYYSNQSAKANAWRSVLVSLKGHETSHPDVYKAALGRLEQAQHVGD